MKLIIFSTFIIYAIFANISACAEDFITFDNPKLTREERLIKLQVIKHRTALEIDSPRPAIQISMEKTSMPDEYIKIPVKGGR